MTVLTKPESDLLANLNGRLPSTPEEIREAIGLGEEDFKEGRVVPAEEVIKGLERIRAKHAQKI
jgi:hypothetical protein